jgi:hypothetical protein
MAELERRVAAGRAPRGTTAAMLGEQLDDPQPLIVAAKGNSKILS